MNVEELDQVFAPVYSREKFMVEMEDKAKIAVYKFLPEKEDKTKYPILFVPGFMAYLGQWSPIINTLVLAGFPVYVYESREKKSSTSKVTDPKFNTEGLISDLLESMQFLNLPKPFVMIGNSLGTTIIMKHITINKTEKFVPEKIILFEAVYKSDPLKRLINLAKKPFRFRLGMQFLKVFAPVLYLRRRRQDPYGYRKSINRLKNADVEKMRVGLIQSVTMKIVDDLPKITMPALLLGRNTDETHPIEQAMLIQDRIADGKYVEMYTDEAMHSEEAAKHIIDFLLEK
ncbi:MAG: alpha/beta fold hydrolase [Candidatus Heimdallarchaeota archaeon]